MVGVGEPHDGAHRVVRAVWVRQSPDEVSTRLLHLLEGRGVFGRSRDQVLQVGELGEDEVENLASVAVASVSAPLEIGEHPIEVRRPVDQHEVIMPHATYVVQDIDVRVGEIVPRGVDADPESRGLLHE